MHAPESDDWLQCLFAVYRMTGTPKLTLEFASSAMTRITSSKALTWEVGLAYSCASLPTEALSWVAACIQQWPDDQQFWSLLLDLFISFSHGTFTGSGTFMGSTFIPSVANHGVRGLQFHLIGQVQASADELVEGHRKREWDSYLNMLAMHTEVMQIAGINFEGSIQNRFASASDVERLFYAIIAVRSGDYKFAQVWIESLDIEGLYYSDLYLALLVINAGMINAEGDFRRFVLAYLSHQKRRLLGLNLCLKIAQKGRDLALAALVTQRLNELTEVASLEIPG